MLELDSNYTASNAVCLPAHPSPPSCTSTHQDLPRLVQHKVHHTALQLQRIPHAPLPAAHGSKHIVTGPGCCYPAQGCIRHTHTDKHIARAASAGPPTPSSPQQHSSTDAVCSAHRHVAVTQDNVYRVKSPLGGHCRDGDCRSTGFGFDYSCNAEQGKQMNKAERLSQLV